MGVAVNNKKNKAQSFIMTNVEILNTIGQFSVSDCELFDKYTSQKTLNKNDILLKNGEVCQSFYFVLQGSFIQYQDQLINEQVVDLHLKNEWMFNQESLTAQLPSLTNIKAFSTSEILVLSLHNLHFLCAKSQAFLQFGKILNQTKHRTSLYDNLLTPSEKYQFITKAKPELTSIFPLKLIASYLKMTPETLSRVRASY